MTMKKGGAVYIMTNKHKTTLYIGVTSNLPGRVWQHIHHFYPKSFTARYNLTYCVYYEYFFSIVEAIAREKELKHWRREKKDALITSMNPEWKDFWEEIKEFTSSRR
jgi:putative endonuclease